jgi:hypothetical protein
MAERRPTPSLHGLLVEAGLRNLLVDRMTVEVHAAFLAQGIPSIVLKGPAIANWLYGGADIRGYGDSDLLIPRRDWDKAAQILTALGFENDLSIMAHPRMESFASDPWLRGNDNLDLHSTIYGVDADFETVWDVLWASTERMEIGGASLPVLAPPARLMHIALHAAQHTDGKAVYDLDRAMQQLPEELWWEAADVAGRLDALAAFAAGLRLAPGGDELARRMGIAEVRRIHVDLRAGQVPLSESLNELLETQGALPKLRMAFAEVVPRPAFMRWWFPPARRSRIGMALAYAWRPIYLVLRAPAAIAAVRRARRTP